MAVNPRHLMLSAIANCPHLIFDAGHYRTDGTCRCDDPDHTVMAAAGYIWDAQSRRWAATKELGGSSRATCGFLSVPTHKMNG